MEQITKADVKVPVAGIFLMTIFTVIWALIAENALHNRDHRILGIILLLIVLIFLSFYIRFLKLMKGLPEAPQIETDDKKRGRQILIINSIEGIGIFLSNVILVNLRLTQFFIPVLALLVGLHFFLLGRVLQNKFHYYMGIWTTAIAVTGLILTYNKSIPADFIIVFVGIGCALSTISYTIRFILIINAKIKLYQENRSF